MVDVKRITCLVAAIALAACTSNKAEVNTAKHSLYDTDFAVVYSAALDAVRKLYPNIDDSPGNGAIKTAWHQVQYASDPSQDSAGRSISTNPNGGMGGMGGNGMGGTSPAAGTAGMSTRLAYKRYYVRFDVSVIGGRPWRVKVQGHASEWEPGAAMPVEMKGAARPPWLDPRIDALRVAIYEKVKPYAIAMKEDIQDKDKEPAATDPAVFKEVPPGAAKLLANTKDILAKRDYPSLRPDLADDVVWNAGQEPSADTAMAMWQADGDAFEELNKLISGGCAKESDKRVTCPATAPAVGQWQLVLEQRGVDWKIVSFMRVELQ
jgi:hypothetical protein